MTITQDLLRAFARWPSLTNKDAADLIGQTVQITSIYVCRMRHRGQLEYEGKQRRPTLHQITSKGRAEIGVASPAASVWNWRTVA